MQLRVKPSAWITASGLSPACTLSTARIRISCNVLWSRARASRRFMPSIVLYVYLLMNVLIIRGSELEWTLLRPPKLTDIEHTGRYRVREGHLPRFGFSISRANVSDCFFACSKTLPLQERFSA